MPGSDSYSEVDSDAMMTIAAARVLADARTCFVGIGLPSVAANLARRLHNPGLVLVYESGTLGSKPTHLPLSIGDGILAETADSVVSVPEIFNYWLQPGRIEVGFLGAAQIDRYASINTTVIGATYAHPDVRLPGAGGAPEIAACCREVVVIVRQSRRTFVEKVDFVTSVGVGPIRVVTDLGELVPDPRNRELTLTAVHPGVTVEQARSTVGWDLRVSPSLVETPAPTEEELTTLRSLVTERASA